MHARCSWSIRKSRSNQEELEPVLYAALVDSMLQNFWPMLIGSICAAACGGDDGAQDRQRAVVAVRHSDRRNRHHPRVPDAQVRTAHRGAVVRSGKTSGTTLRSRRHGLCRGARRLVLHHHSGQRRRHRAYALRRRDDRLYRRRRGTQLRPSEARAVSYPARVRSDVAGAGAAWRILLHRPRRAAGAVLHRPERHQPQPPCHLREGADLEFPGSGAGRPVRHRPEQHAPRPVHVRRRWAACRHESPLQRDDEPVRRSGAARRQRVRHHRRLRQRRIDLGGERKDDPLGNREYAGEGYHHRRSRHRQKPVAVLDIPADGGRRRRRAAGRHHRAAQRRSQDHPSGALRRTDRAAQPGQFPRRDRASAGHSARCRAIVGIAVRRPRSVQAGQRYPRSSVRRPAVVRGRRPAARHAAPGGFRGALRRRRIRGVPAEHQIERGSRQFWRGGSSNI